MVCDIHSLILNEVSLRGKLYIRKVESDKQPAGEVDRRKAIGAGAAISAWLMLGGTRRPRNHL